MQIVFQDWHDPERVCAYAPKALAAAVSDALKELGYSPNASLIQTAPKLRDGSDAYTIWADAKTNDSRAECHTISMRVAQSVKQKTDINPEIGFWPS